MVMCSLKAAFIMVMVVPIKPLRWQDLFQYEIKVAARFNDFFPCIISHMFFPYKRRFKQ